MAQPTENYSVEVDPFYVQDLRQMAKAENYRRWQFEMVAPHIHGRVLEVGGGIGNFTPELAGAAESVISIEPNEYCFKQLREKTRALTNVSVHQATVESLDEKVPLARGLDTVVLMNVLEHIQDDRAVLELLKQRLKPGGKIVVLVPACQWAFGSTDARLGHYRRYSKPYTRQLVAKIGMQLTAMRYYNFIGIWGWWWNAKFAKRESQSDAQIRLFDKVFVPVISRVEKFMPPPVGQSLLFVARAA